MNMRRIYFFVCIIVLCCINSAQAHLPCPVNARGVLQCDAEVKSSYKKSVSLHFDVNSREESYAARMLTKSLQERGYVINANSGDYSIKFFIDKRGYDAEAFAIIPEGNHFIAVAVYCIGMALFTMIMGNGFAAFAVITVGIGYPFLIAQGANPVVVGALGLTAGYCGTLMTPMAANFNIMPAALLETKSKYAIIISQLPVALIMLAIHIVLMYVLAF